MLSEALAGRFLEKVAEYTDYNINIMNQKGIIIASRTESRVGTFHEIAFRILHGEEDEIDVDESSKFIGVKEGINMAVLYEGKRVGVIGITGEPEKIRPVALLLRMSLETALDYEAYKEARFQRRSLKEQFISQTIYGSRTQEDEDALEECARRLGLEQKFVRAPILFRFPDASDNAEKILQCLRDYHFISRQDVIGLTRNNGILLLRHFEDAPPELIRDYKSLIKENVGQLLWYLNNHTSRYGLYVGSCQRRFGDYHTGYLHCKWLSDNFGKEQGGIYFFYDYVGTYFHSLLPLPDLKGVFGFFAESFDDKFLESYCEIMTALDCVNYNLEEAGKKMHVHKNTVVYRLNKIRSSFSLNPLFNHREREFAVLFHEYLKRSGS